MVKAWCVHLKQSQEIPDFPAGWTAMVRDDIPTHEIPAGESRRYGRFKWPSWENGKRHFVLAAASCDGDLANVEASSGLPCAERPGPIKYLVACDNNLGLREVFV
jgi:hypothetical protein